MKEDMKNPLIYIISGKARSGKDTTALFLSEYYKSKSKKVITLAYGNYIKEYAKKISAWDGNEDTKPRTLLETLGTDIIRNNIDELFFIKRMTGDICVYYYFFDVIIISDARFKEEITIIKEQFDDVKDIHIKRPNFDNGLTEEQKSHKTETSLDDYKEYDYLIENDGTLEDLNNKVIKIVEEVENER